jgi:hypothetical protein
MVVRVSASIVKPVSPKDRTGQVCILPFALLVLGRLDDLLQSLVVDIRRCPLGDLIMRQILSKLHGACASRS